ncbi:tRNA dihydrouridine synthase DusB [Candidatus Cardinium hertigii]|uniref:tRNA-dihydrouridine synthase n=1 Tax=Candidatus Cardinium hertigii TaxID=247481 RepID=A0A2Z3L9I4_9BACT|nr:tRNA dihydrouridine synthase DusB [Candidatus Cardinium hertigii]AWN82193.1 putative tRNA-dihydrouridine synthase [Candidatus Cardinium hertigii]
MVQIGDLKLSDFPLLLAPMEEVSDPPFRAICKTYGADLMYTEFISSEGLTRNANKSLKKLTIYEQERPIGIQIFGEKIEVMREAAAIVEQAQPTLLDINYGCPVKQVACRGAGAGILLDLPKMQAMAAEIVKQVSIPVTVKTRLGWDHHSIKIVEVVQRLQDVGIQAVSIHGRTRQQMYKGIADWSYIAAVKAHPGIHIPIFGNGDIDTPLKAIAYKEKYGVDGIMIGRATIGYPWIFREIKHYYATGTLLPPPTLVERVATIQQHLSHAIQWKGMQTAMLEMRRHYSNYFKGIPYIKPYRAQLVEASSYAALCDVLEEIAALPITQMVAN